MIEFLSGGMQTTIQDLGRRGMMHLGIGLSGAMDSLSAITANRLLGAPDNSPVLECTLVGPNIKFHTANTIAICGSDMRFKIDDKPVPNNQTVHVDRNTVLTYLGNASGARAYIAFAKPLLIEPVMNSAATHLSAAIGGHHGRAVKIGDRIRCDERELATTDHRQIDSLANYSGRYVIRYTPAPESKHFSESQYQTFHNNRYNVSTEFSRMGIRLVGEKVKFSLYPTMPSRGLLPGSIQLPPDGTPIIAGKDCQTTGGYLRIGQVIACDLPIIGQLKAQDEVQFLAISIANAIALNVKQQQLLANYCQ